MMTDAIQALAQHWSDIADLLSEEQRQAVADPVRELLAAADADARREAALDIVEIVAPLLPAGHPVRRALAGEASRYAQAAQDWDPPVDLLRGRLARFDLEAGWSVGRPGGADDPAGAGAQTAGAQTAGEADGAQTAGEADGAQTAGEADDQAEEWLLAAPAVDAEEVRRRGLDPDSPGLIRIGRTGRDWRWPAFQFDAAGRPHEVVTQINLLLNADGDPWGVADWWLGPNAWLDASPADLIGRIDDALLLDAATALLSEA